ncbi:MAG: DUF1638 domain-containing protein [Spirochaetota bacterium]
MHTLARYRLIACSVFQRELCLAIAETPNLVDPEFHEISLHERPNELRTAVQARIDAVSAMPRLRGKAYEAILLGYGLCGNGLAGIEARDLPLVLPRAHDCCTILLGSRAEFLSRFGENLSASWSSTGYLERGTSGFRMSDPGSAQGIGQSYDDLVREYGEENASFVWETLHPEAVEKVIRYIEVPETARLGHAEALRARAVEEGKDFLTFTGSMRLLRGLVEGGWDPSEFLVIPPWSHLEPTWDHDKVFEAK